MPGFCTKIMLCCCLGRSVATAFGAEPPAITFATRSSRDSLLYRRFQILYSDAFRRLGLSFRLISVPNDQAAAGATLGVFDGDGNQTQELEQHSEFSSLLRIDVPTSRGYHAAFIENRRVKIQNWSDIKLQNLVVAYLRGQIYAADKVKELQLPVNRVLIAEHCTQLLDWLQRGQAAVVIDNVENCSDTRRLERFKHIQVAVILDEELSYPYLHKKHRNLLLKLEEALKASLADPLIYGQLLLLEHEVLNQRAGLIKVQLYTPYDFPPFIVNRAMQEGLIYDFQRYLNALADGLYHFTVQAVPRIPVERLARMRDPAIVPFVTPSWFKDESGQQFDWTLPLMEDEYAIVSHRSLALDSVDAAKVKGKILCGSLYLKHDARIQKLQDDGTIKITQSPNTGHCLQMIAHGRADFYFAGRLLTDYYLQRPELAGQLPLTWRPYQHFERRVLITPKATDLLGWFNQKIQNLKKCPAWRAMMKTWHVASR